MVEKISLNDLKPGKMANFENTDNQRFTKKENTNCEVSTLFSLKQEIKYNNCGKSIASIGDILKNPESRDNINSETNGIKSNFSPEPNFEQPNKEKKVGLYIRIGKYLDH